MSPSTILLLTIVCVITLDSHTVAACPAGCSSCSNGRIQCPGSGQTSLPIPLPPDTVSIDLTQNRISSLDNLPELPDCQSFRISMNLLTKIKGDSFASLPNLMSLDLSMNMIKKVYKHGLRGSGEVKTISLNGNKMDNVGVIFRNTPKVTSIRLGNNHLTRIGEENFELNTVLKMLDLSSNRITSIHSNAFANLNMLRYLVLTNNPITTLTDLTFSSTMLSLADFTNCQLTSVPKTMPPSLSDYRLGNNNIERINLEDFQNITNLKMLTLNDNKIAHVDHRSFGYNENLKELWLSRNDLVYIPRGLPKGLKKLFIDNNVVVELEQMLFAEGAELVELTLEGNKVSKVHQDALKDVEKLEKLSLQGNDITRIEAGTFTHVPKLQSLTFTDNPIEVFENGAFANLDSLTDLSLSYIEPSDTSENMLAENIFTSMPNLTNIDMMSSGDLSKAVFEMLQSQSVQPMEKVKKWNLQYNDITTMPAIVTIVFPNIQQILLDGNLFVCDNRLLWLHGWMQTADSVAFHQYEHPTCDSPYNLAGQQIVDVATSDFGQPEQVPEESVVNQQQAEVAEQNPEASNSQRNQPSNENGVLEVVTEAAAPEPTTPAPTPEHYRYPIRGTVVKITPPKGHSSAVASKKPAPATTKEKSHYQLLKEQRQKAREKRRREKEERKRLKRLKKLQKKNKGQRKKRRIKNKKGSNCKKDADGNTKCEKKQKKNKKGNKKQKSDFMRCKKQEDGTVKCWKRKARKQNTDIAAVPKPNTDV